eukprot:CAMPEP_0198570328 /NCGR_PEP_ID=MMETSP1462-20131121/108959_1 /TAXON_ID=1333877 /ORGANISM="Brandtodinium nutriculum, Strain RCC3387" /LENGTH=66 /DNA_ID=CAMNT_0044301443 /DNA_START=18 /DNA_END=214 /DNA_ORIENTATION=+
MAQDEDGGDVFLCRRCNKPLGDYGFGMQGRGKFLMHQECAAELMLQDRRLEEEARKKASRELKQAR